ncbi:MAG: hypothetical protein M3478_08640 [Planctomycetota bacterium]|nr:hypothetical protein [Planctomycetota bacterium]
MGSNRRGIMLTDVVLGLALLATIGVLLSATVGRHGRATDRLYASRAALRAAEHVLTDLQRGQAPPASDERTRWDVRRLESPAPAGQAWIEVHVVHRERSATLTGLAPASSLKGAAP